MKHLQRWAVLATLLLSPIAGLAETHAVLIGIDKYDNPDITALRYTVNDVKAFHDLLVDPSYGGAKPENVVLMVPEAERALRPTRAGILVQIKKAALRTQPDDTLILYFAGHGMETGDGRFLLGVDADPLLLADTAVPIDRLPAILEDVRASKVLVIVDACRNDPAAGRAQADNPMGEAFERGLRPRVLSPAGPAGPRQVATWLACGVGQRAWEYSQHEHGVFSYYLLAGLKGDAAQDGEVSLSRLAENVEGKVAEWARRNGKEQTPKLDNPDRLDLILSRPRPRPGGVEEIPLATIEVGSEPVGATVLVDNEVKGKTPLKVTVMLPGGQAKRVTVQLQLEGYEPAAAGVELVAGQTQSWQKTLTKQAQPTVVPDRPIVTPDQPQPEPHAQDRPASWMPGWEAGPDGLPVVSIQGGTVQLGTNREDADMTERPQHTVSLSDYKIQAVEVTNEAFARTLNLMMASGAITFDADGNVVTTQTATGDGSWPAGLVLIFTSSPDCRIGFNGARGGPVEPAGQFSVSDADHDLPAVPVTWFGAALYAAWNGMRLPTEAEWERAAQARNAADPYPWGTAPITPRLASVDTDDLAELREVGDLRNGVSGSGCLHMVGNAWEWTADRFIPDYHRQAQGADPQIGFAPGEYVEMTLRGGGYMFPAELTTVWTRTSAYAGDYGEDYGFRCVVPSRPLTNVILPKVSGGDGKTRMGVDGGKPLPDDDDDDDTAPVGQVYQHPLNGTRLAIPEGWEALPQPTGAVLIGNEDDEAGVIYFYISPVYNTPEAVHAATMAELQQLGLEWGQPSSSGTLVLTDAIGPVQVFRNEYAARADGEDVLLIVDVLVRNGIFHALVFAAPTDVFEDYRADYQTVLTASVYP